MLRGSFPSAGKKSGVIWCLGGAIINKIAFVLISTDSGQSHKPAQQI